jgi:pyridoxamine 5'-phosphate oxidase
MDTHSGSPDGRSVREWLRGLEVFAGPLAQFDPAEAPEDPVELFLAWLTAAVVAGLPDPHAMTVSTVDEHGQPDARVLILKNVDATGWQFAGHAESPKGRQLTGQPRAALSFSWPSLGRQVRVRGPVVPEPARDGAADLLARSASARAEVLLARQSTHLASEAERLRAFDAAVARIAAEPDLVSPEWTLFRVVPFSIEFWQAAKDRNHTRLRYERDEAAGDGAGDGIEPAADAGWRRHLLWP